MKIIKVIANNQKVLPTRHLSIRVPWHDNKWNGTTCRKVLDNSFCRILPLVDQKKDPDKEPCNAIINDSNLPPCISERGSFLSPNEYTREINHRYKEINNPLFKDFGPCPFHHKPYSFSTVPFRWVMKSPTSFKKHDHTDFAHKSVKAIEFEVDYKTELEQKIDPKLGFEGNIWVQDPENQKNLLDTFFGCLHAQKSLIFFYSKHTPLSEPNERVIIGVAKVSKTPGDIQEYKFPKNYSGHRSYPWDRLVEHTLRPKDGEGFLLPYHEILEYADKNNADIDLHGFVVPAPDLNQFSYAAELVEHDTAIDALLNIAESLRKSQHLLGVSFQKELEWIDTEISKIWDMRGAFPSLGSVLSALGIESGNTIAWEIEKYIIKKDGDLLKINPWIIFEESVRQPDKYLGFRGKELFKSVVQTIWGNKPDSKKQFYKFISRCQLSNEQAAFLIKRYSKSPEEVFHNPYLLYEKTRFEEHGISFHQIDKALFPPEKIKASFPLNEEVAIDNQLDTRRVRALCVWVLEDTAINEGHSLLPFDDLLIRLSKKQLEERFPIDEDTLMARAKTEFFTEEIKLILPSEENRTIFLKLQRLQQVKQVIRNRINPQIFLNRIHNLEKDWLQIVNEHFEKRKDQFSVAMKQTDEEEARYEKAMALKILTNYRFSVLIGPAGSGKTKLLEIFEEQPEIKRGGVLKLAPTGKARVKLGANAKTVAQFLYPYRYNPYTGVYCLNDGAPKYSNVKTVIIDESSMLTEEQLAALLDALGQIDRLILVGDYRQLPPIGTGRPFFDICQRLKPDKSDSQPIAGEESFKPFTGPAYAELTKIMRQAEFEDRRWDVALSKCFSDNLDKESIEVFRELCSGEVESNHISFKKWYASDDFRVLFKEILEKELELDEFDLEKSFNASIGAETDERGLQYFNQGIAEKKAEDWQIISPINGYGFGVKEINKFVQTTYRKRFIDLALGKMKLIAKPKGVDNVVYGDKIINLRNSKWEDWQKIEPRDKKSSALNYIANGEIGVITGDFRSWGSNYQGEANIEITFTTQPGYSYVFYPTQLGEESKYSVELAYAITVHKAQGSGFKKVFFVLPSKGSILSRELLYTALTRQEDKIIILHQGDFRDFIQLASTEASATARRFTDLYFLPDIKQIETRFYDSKYINISERGEPMISKNEVIIANLLNKYKDQIYYSYENKFKFEGTGISVKPDFTIENQNTGRIFYWEHLGMMTIKKYREEWQRKLESYLTDGFVLHHKAQNSDDKILIITEENPNGGIDSQEFDRLIRRGILEEEIFD